MSKQLTFSASISVIAVALFALSVSVGAIRPDVSYTLAGNAPIAEFSVGR